MERFRNGWIETICGCMFSGKSEELIRRVRRVQLARQSVMVFKPELDNRYSDIEIVSHNGTSLAALSVKHAEEILKHVRPGTDCVAIDEVQFFDQTVVEVAQTLADRGCRVICAGLDLDFKGDPFGPMPYILSVSELVTKLQAVCVRCGGPASRTQRLVDGEPAHVDDPVILVGASERYEPRCRHCHEVKGARQKVF